jgi:hypothetical protein
MRKSQKHAPARRAPRIRISSPSNWTAEDRPVTRPDPPAQAAPGQRRTCVPAGPEADAEVGSSDTSPPRPRAGPRRNPGPPAPGPARFVLDEPVISPQGGTALPSDCASESRSVLVKSSVGGAAGRSRGVARRAACSNHETVTSGACVRIGMYRAGDGAGEVHARERSHHALRPVVELRGERAPGVGDVAEGLDEPDPRARAERTSDCRTSESAAKRSQGNRKLDNDADVAARRRLLDAEGDSRRTAHRQEYKRAPTIIARANRARAKQRRPRRCRTANTDRRRACGDCQPTYETLAKRVERPTAMPRQSHLNNKLQSRAR